MLLRYPKIDTPEIISAGWTFDQTLTRKSTTVSYATPPEDTSEDMLVYRDKDNNIIGSISFTQYADGNVGVNFKLGEHTYTIRISDEGHIDLRSSYPLCGFVSGTDEVATAEYVIDCSKANDEILESSLKEFINTGLADLETSLKNYTDTKVADLKDYVDAKVQLILQDIMHERAIMKQWVKDYVEQKTNISTDLQTAVNEAISNHIASGFLWSINSIGCLRLVYIRESSEDFAVHSLKAGDTIDPSKYVIWMAGSYFQFNNDDKQYIYPNGGTDDTGDYASYTNSRITVGTWKLLSPYYSRGTAVRVYMARLCLIVRIR
jgi:hypothetical protein